MDALRSTVEPTIDRLLSGVMLDRLKSSVLSQIVVVPPLVWLSRKLSSKVSLASTT